MVFTYTMNWYYFLGRCWRGEERREGAWNDLIGPMSHVSVQCDTKLVVLLLWWNILHSLLVIKRSVWDSPTLNWFDIFFKVICTIFCFHVFYHPILHIFYYNIYIFFLFIHLASFNSFFSIYIVHRFNYYLLCGYIIKAMFPVLFTCFLWTIWRILFIF